MTAAVMIVSVIVAIATAAAAYEIGCRTGARTAEAPEECRKRLADSEAAEHAWRKYALQLEEEIAELEHGTTVTSEWLLGELEKATQPHQAPVGKVA